MTDAATEGVLSTEQLDRYHGDGFLLIQDAVGVAVGAEGDGGKSDDEQGGMG